jgi:hypothetical protein
MPRTRSSRASRSRAAVACVAQIPGLGPRSRATDQEERLRGTPSLPSGSQRSTCLNRLFRASLLPLIQGVSPAVPGGLAEGYLLLGVRVQMALHAIAMAPNPEISAASAWAVTCRIWAQMFHLLAWPGLAGQQLTAVALAELVRLLWPRGCGSPGRLPSRWTASPAKRTAKQTSLPSSRGAACQRRPNSAVADTAPVRVEGLRRCLPSSLARAPRHG